MLRHPMLIAAGLAVAVPAVGVTLAAGEQLKWTSSDQLQQLASAFGTGHPAPTYYQREGVQAQLKELHKKASLTLLTGPQGCGKSEMCDNFAAIDDNSCYVGLTRTSTVHDTLMGALRLHRVGWREAFHKWRFWGAAPKEELGTGEIVALLGRYQASQGGVPLLIIDDCNSLDSNNLAILGEFVKQVVKHKVASVLLVFSPGDNLGKLNASSAGRRVANEIRMPDLNEEETIAFFRKTTGQTAIPSDLYHCTSGRVNNIITCQTTDPHVVKQNELDRCDAAYQQLPAEQHEPTLRMLSAVISKAEKPILPQQFEWLQEHNFIKCDRWRKFEMCVPDSPLVVEWFGLSGWGKPSPSTPS